MGLLDRFASREYAPEMKEAFYVYSPNGLFQLDPGDPRYPTPFGEGGILPSNDEQISLHDRDPVIMDQMRNDLYKRDGTARMIVDDPAVDTWMDGFRFKDAPDTTADKVQRVLDMATPAITEGDQWSRLHGVSLVVFGFDDGRRLRQPTAGEADEVIWTHVLKKNQVRRVTYDKDPSSRRYRQPLRYEIRTGKPGADPSSGETTIHADRVLRMVENPHIHPVIGGSSLDAPWNDLKDLSTMTWSSAEAFKNYASPRMILKTQRPLSPKEKTKVDTAIKKGRSSSRDVLKMLHSMDLQPVTVASNFPPPEGYFKANFTRLMHATGFPLTKFMEDHLTSGEAIMVAQVLWNRYIVGRRRSYGRRHVTELLRMLQQAGVLPGELKPSGLVWNHPEVLSREELSKISRNESIAWASSVKTGRVPQDLVDRFVEAPKDVLDFLEKMNQKGQPSDGSQNQPGSRASPTGERSIQQEQQERARTRGASR